MKSILLVLLLAGCTQVFGQTVWRNVSDDHSAYLIKYEVGRKWPTTQLQVTDPLPLHYDAIITVYYVLYKEWERKEKPDSILIYRPFKGIYIEGAKFVKNHGITGNHYGNCICGKDNPADWISVARIKEAEEHTKQVEQAKQDHDKHFKKE